jgi:hypothetical protein
VRDRFAAAGIAGDAVTFDRDTWTFRSPEPPAGFLDEFRRYYGPSMNAFAAAEADGKAAELHAELEELFTSCNTSGAGDTVIPATYLRVTVDC